MSSGQNAGLCVGVVVIGRNEGERLAVCLRSLGVSRVVYVDSGSTDGSVELARGMGVECVELDQSLPFTAARARNTGFSRLIEVYPDTRFVQFVDGDCELRGDWLLRGEAALVDDQRVVTVCGRLRERYPDRSVYNRMCDLGWDYPLGEITSCGGVAMYRADRFKVVGGFNEELIAGEEFELCSRLRSTGGRVVRIEAEMAWHDVGITRFGQWWRRAVRAGYSYAEGWLTRPKGINRGHRRSAIRALGWGLLLPLVALAGAAGAWIWWPFSTLSIAAVLLVALQILRLAFAHSRNGRRTTEAAAFAGFLVMAKIPESEGVLRYCFGRVFHRRSAIIEYR